MSLNTLLTALGKASSVAAFIVVGCWLLSAEASAQEPEPQPLKLPPVETLEPEKPEDLDTDNPAYRPANELVAKSRDLLKILNIDQSLLRRALQGIELGEEDLELLLAMLFRLPQLDIEKVEELVQPLPDWEKLDAETPRYLGGVFRLRGIVKNFQDLTPPEFNSAPPNPDETLDGSLKRLASRLTISRIYRTDILVSGKVLEVYSNRVPHAWLKKKKRDDDLYAWQGGQEVEVWGYLLKQGSPASGPAYYFAAPRVRWYPNTTLGKLGFDYELFDDVQQQRTLLKGENEIFYEFLATAKRTPSEIYQLAKTQENEIVELWRAPEKQVGELLSFRGLTRHVARIAVEDPALAKRLGFDHYYYLELFVPLKTPTIVQIQMNTKDEEDLVLPEANSSSKDPPFVRLAKNHAVAFSRALRFDQIHFESMPLVFYFHELPAGETVLTLKNKQVEVRGFFLKSWRYQSNVPLTNKQHASLFGPLLMGNQPQIIVATASTGMNIPGILILSVIALSLLAGIFYLWLNQHERNRRPLAMPEKIELHREELDV